MIKRLIFDVDGTLIVGVNFVSSIEATLKKMNLYSKENVEKFLVAIKTYESKYNSYNKKDYLKLFGDFLGVELKENFIDVFFDELKFCIPDRNENLINKIEELSKNYELVLLTNYFGISQMNRLNNMGIGKFFTEVYGEELIKPNKSAYINACGYNKPKECIMIGDDLVLDIENAKNLGLNTIFVNSKNVKDVNLDTIIVQSVEEIDSELINRADMCNV